MDGDTKGFSTGTPKTTEEEKDLLSNIITTLNDMYALDLTEEDAVDIEAMRDKINEHDELREVMTSNNTLQNMQYKFDKVVDDLLLEFVNTKIDLYKKLTDKKVNTLFKHKWFEGYHRQFRSGMDARV